MALGSVLVAKADLFEWQFTDIFPFLRRHLAGPFDPRKPTFCTVTANRHSFVPSGVFLVIWQDLINRRAPLSCFN